VNGERWLRVPTLHGRAPDDPVYVARASDDGRVEVRFGDGVSGARVPTGRANVVARYRQGAGLVGRVPADALGTLLDRPQGLRGVINPLPSDGGADPETLADARRNAPATVRTFGRAVALRDFEDVVRSSGEVAKALATWVWTGRLRAVHVTVAAAGGARLSADALARLHDALDRQRDVNIPLRLANHEPVSVVLEATLRVDERRVQADVLAAARAAIEGALAFDAVAFGASMNLSDVYRVLQDVPGVMSVDVDRLHFRRRDAAFLAERGATADAVQGRLVIFAARPPAPGGTVVRPAELARLEVPAQDVTLRAVGGLPGAGGGA
jgi:predicted phage baseplate assembly protein